MEKVNQVEMIKSDLGAWNRWRQENPDVKINLSRVDFSNLNLEGVNFFGCHFFETNFSGANLTGANFLRSDLTGSDFSNSDISKVNFSGADLRGVKFNGANFAGANCESAHFHNVNLSGIDFAGVKFSGAGFYKANLSNTNLSNTSFYGCNLKKANLSGANITKADFRKADFDEADLSNVYFDEGVLSTYMEKPELDPCNPPVNFDEANLNYVKLCNAQLPCVNFIDIDFAAADLSGGNFKGCNFGGAKLHHAKLCKADFSYCVFAKASLKEANCSQALFYEANFEKANLRGANLTGANLNNAFLGRATLSLANLSGADLTETDLTEASLVQAKIQGVSFKNTRVYGVSAWGIEGVAKDESSIVITSYKEAKVTVDDLQVAQFIYLLLNRENLRNVLNTITSKAVLILGRFTPERKAVLDGIGEELRKHNLLPIIFDFERAVSRDFTETIKILAGMSFFVIADITNPKSSPLELQAVVPDYQIPFVPIIEEGQNPFSMFADLGKYEWVLQTIKYSSLDTLRLVFKDLILNRALEKHKQLQIKKAKEIQTLSADEYLKQKKGF